MISRLNNNFYPSSLSLSLSLLPLPISLSPYPSSLSLSLSLSPSSLSLSLSVHSSSSFSLIQIKCHSFNFFTISYSSLKGIIECSQWTASLLSIIYIKIDLTVYMRRYEINITTKLSSSINHRLNH